MEEVKREVATPAPMLRRRLLTWVVWSSCFISFFALVSPAGAQVLVELNCENLFDTRHDEGKDDMEFLPDGPRHWTPAKYWRKLNAIGQEILSCSEQLPDLVALVEIENDSVLHDLTRRSLLRHAGYEYLMTASPDVRGLDCALLYQPACFRPLCYDELEVTPLTGMRPTRSILHVVGETIGRDTLHVFVVHAPSRYGGELETRPFRRQVVETLLAAIDDVNAEDIIVVGDFNDYAESPSLQLLETHGLRNVSCQAPSLHGRARGTYRYQGEWRSIDHVLVSPAMALRVDTVRINDAPFLLEEETRYGGWKPFRTFNGFRYHRGFSDHLPLVVSFRKTTK